jgi:hypothetical protein
MNILPLLIQLASGAAGGNLVSCGCEKISLGPIVSSLTGMLGGDVGAKLLQLATAGGQIEGTSDMHIFLTSLLGGAAGGAAVTALLGWVKEMLSKWF